MDDGRWTMDDGRWTMDDGRWTMDDGRWTMDDGRWTMEDGRWTISLTFISLISLRHTHSFQQGKLQLFLAKPDKDKYDTRVNKQHNLQQ